MKKKSISYILNWISCLCPISLIAQVNTSYYDGPYIFYQNDSLRIQWVEAGISHDTLICKSEANLFQRDSLPVVNLQDLHFEPEKQSTFKDIEKIVALSDVHGQYDLMIELLKANEVIDDQNHWKYGNGHLVIVGDNMDRGGKVMDILWYLFFLQKEAIKAGGKVHVMIGNHEIMVLNGDLRYLHPKYRYTSASFTKIYRDFFEEGSILGDWIASHQVMLSINQRLFIHAGVSPSILDLKMSIKKINQTFRQQIIRRHEDAIYKDQKLAELYGESGPLWYRGYFDSLALEMEEVDRSLKRFKQKTIIIGHTSLKAITPMYDGKIIAIDCSIKLGKTGQVLIFEQDKIFIGELDGNRNAIVQTQLAVPSPKTNLFDHIYKMESNPKLKITTNFKQLIKKKGKEEYQSSEMELTSLEGDQVFKLKGRIRTRGNMRKKVCMLPPVKLDFSKSELDSLEFLKLDKLKLIFPCSYSALNQEKLYKEYFLYELYNLIDSNGIRAKLVDVELIQSKKTEHLVAAIIEDEASYEQRKNATIVEKGKISAGYFDRSSFVKMQFYQYMIANTDWSLDRKHNLEIVKLNSENKLIALPYDFDYSGFVGQGYAIPHESLPIKDVDERFFIPHKVSDEEFFSTVKFYQSIEPAVYTLCDNATYMNEKTISSCKGYLKSFFKLLEDPKKLKKNVLPKI
ncbi:MAG: metallophosphoesterase [Saprospiraceae bacterium]|nr:metallophosphoesterase [Saprospiraceae bacterium]